MAQAKHDVRWWATALAVLLAGVGLRAAAKPPAPEITWQSLAPGADYAVLALRPVTTDGDGLLHVVRVAPEQVAMQMVAASQTAEAPQSAADWLRSYDAVAVINGGMFEADGRTHTGHFRVGEHVNSATWVANFRSVLLLGPRRPTLPAAQLQDVEPQRLPGLVADYHAVVQNLRLVRDRGRGTWKKNPRRWSEAALAQDAQGRLLLLFTRTPWSMAAFNAQILAQPLGVVRALHLEGGPKASLSVRGPNVALDLMGSFESDFCENDDNHVQAPLPIVLVVGQQAVAVTR